MERENRLGAETAAATFRREVESPKSVEEARARLLASFNAGPKAAAFLLLPRNSAQYIEVGDLVRSFGELAKGTAMEDVNRSTAPDYFHHSFYKVGLVAQELILDYFGAEKLLGFVTTEFGAKYGWLAACQELDFEQRHRFSLFPIFGSTQTPSAEGKRAPQTRARILEFLSGQNRPVRETDICQALGISETLACNALEALKKAGMIDYESVKPHTGKVQVGYRLGQLPIAEVKPYHTTRALTGKVCAICQRLEKRGMEVSQANVFDKLPKKLKRGWDERVLRREISSILSDLAKQGFLQRKEYKGGETRSLAEIEQKGMQVVFESLKPLNQLLSGDLETRKRLEAEVAPRVLAGLAQYCQNSIDLYYPHSMGFKIKESRDNRARALALISQNPGMTCQELAESLGLNPRTIGGYLQGFVQRGQVTFKVRKGVNYYSTEKM